MRTDTARRESRGEVITHVYCQATDGPTRRTHAATCVFLVAVLFLGISAMMLPGIEGFTASNYVLSIALILAISYRWIGLAAYGIASMLLAVRVTAKTAGPAPPGRIRPTDADVRFQAISPKL